MHRAGEVCARPSWRFPEGRLTEMSCRVAMLRTAADGLITLPPPRCAKPVSYRARSEIERATDGPTTVAPVDLRQLTVEVVGKRDSLLWNTYAQR